MFLAAVVASAMFCAAAARAEETAPAAPAPALSDIEARLTEQASKLKKEGQRFGPDFTADKDLAAKTAGPKERTLRFCLIEFRDGEWSPQIIDKADDARKALVAHIAADTGNYVHGFREGGRLAEDENIIASSSNTLYHRFDTGFRTKDGTIWLLTYVVVRPAFLAQVRGQYASWLGNGGRDLVLGKESLGSEKAFAEAADLLARLMYLDDGPILLSRQVERNNKGCQWTATLATWVKGPEFTSDWLFEALLITADARTGAVAISTKPLAALLKLDEARGDKPPAAEVEDARAQGVEGRVISIFQDMMPGPGPRAGPAVTALAVPVHVFWGKLVPLDKIDPKHPALVKVAQADQNGRFKVALPPGVYTVVAEIDSQLIGRRDAFGAWVTVKVEPGKWSTLNIERRSVAW